MGTDPSSSSGPDRTETTGPALFAEPSPGVLIGRAEAVGPHGQNAVAGGPLAAAAVSVLGQPRPEFRLARLTASFHTPVTIGGPISWEIGTTRERRRVAHYQVLMRQQGKLVLTAETTWLHSAPGAFAPASTWPPLAAVPEEEPIAAWNGGFFGGALEVTSGGFHGVGAGSARLRMRSDIISGRARDLTLELVAAADVTHAIGAPITSWPPPCAFINPDLTVCLVRAPAGRLFEVQASAAWPGDGTGLTVGTIADARGVLAHVAQCQVLSGT